MKQEDAVHPVCNWDSDVLTSPAQLDSGELQYIKVYQFRAPLLFLELLIALTMRCALQIHLLFPL